MPFLSYMIILHVHNQQAWSLEHALQEKTVSSTKNAINDSSLHRHGWRRASQWRCIQTKRIDIHLNIYIVKICSYSTEEETVGVANLFPQSFMYSQTGCCCHKPAVTELALMYVTAGCTLHKQLRVLTDLLQTKILDKVEKSISLECMGLYPTTRYQRNICTERRKCMFKLKLRIWLTKLRHKLHK